jgi:tetratricopeptide (TPR) repeat protein/predicted Ser/Thr protein kinase
MDAQRWAVIDSLYHAALEKEPGERSAYLAAACAEDPTLRSEVESLLDYADTQLTSPVELSKMAELLDKIGGIAPPEGEKPVGPAAAGIPPALPAAIGRYRILRLLGEGGMGVVYEVEQEKPRRTVALKVIKPGLASAELLRRFEQESQALGRLQHPGIAQIYEAGTADTGCGPQPYFAMEFIRGESLLEYAKAQELNTRQRLELMAKVCEAVHHAHQRGIIHRDLKPGNILVDESGQPKVLDFGVARVTDSDAQATRQTEVGGLVGTLAYMSPEQVLADPLELDTRSDVYALGVILYELMASRLPYTVSRNLLEAVRAIREEDPVPLSSISRTYRGDIETIVAKTLEKDKARRYASAAGLAGDIRRYLTDEPIVARPPSTMYQLQKFARRHRALVAGAAVVFVVLVAGIVASTWQAMRANRVGQAALAQRDRATVAEKTATKERDRATVAEKTATNERNRALNAEAQAIQERNKAVAERQRADTQAATATAVNDFLRKDLLAQASANEQARPNAKPDPDLKVRTALDRAAARIEGKFDKQPLVEASIRHTIAIAYTDLGLYPEAQRQDERALELRRRVLGEEHPDTLTSMNNLGMMYQHQGRQAQAEALWVKVLEVRRRVLGEEHKDTLHSMNNLGAHYVEQGKYGQAEPLLTKVVEIERRVRGEENYDTLQSMNNLAGLYFRQGKYVPAETIFAEVVEIRERVSGEEHPDTLNSMNNLAVLYATQGKYEQAEALLAKVLEIQRRVLGAEHPDTLFSMKNLGMLYRNDGKYAQAEPLSTEVLEITRHVRGEAHPETLSSMSNLAALHQSLGKYEQAELLFAKVLGVRRRVLGEEHPDTLSSMRELAVLNQRQSKYAEAEALLNKVLEVRRRVLGAEHPDTIETMYYLGALYRRQSKYALAEPLWAKALEVRRRVLRPQHPDTTEVMISLGEMQLSQQRYADSETLLREGLNGWEKARPDGWKRFYSQGLLGATLAGQKRYAEAEPLLVSGYQGMMNRQAGIPSDSRRALVEAGERIVQLYESWGKPEKAAEWREKLQIK